MRKSFIFLLVIFVCALGSAAAQSEPNSETNESVSGTFSVSAKAINTSTLSGSAIASQISEARRLLSSRPTAGMASDRVTLAAFDPETSQTTIVSLPKKEFLTKDADLSATSEPGRSLRVHVVRANGVNTAVTVTDVSNGRSLLPLLVQFPIVKGGAVTEMAYYTSAHPALLSSSATAA